MNYLTEVMNLVLRDLAIPQVCKVTRMTLKPNKPEDAGTSYR